jgi:hypothetical protein
VIVLLQVGDPEIQLEQWIARADFERACINPDRLTGAISPRIDNPEIAQGPDVPRSGLQDFEEAPLGGGVVPRRKRPRRALEHGFERIGGRKQPGSRDK